VLDRNEGEFSLGPSLEFLRRLWRLNHALERASYRMDDALGLTAQQRFLLRFIGRFPGIAPGDAARALHVDPGTVSSTIRRLEAKKLVTRKRDTTDARRIALRLTAKGRAMDQPDERSVEAAVERLLRTSSPSEILAAEKLIDRLAEILDSQ
jgi:MarR family transcriptional regulator, organic hydroperoxide resistance regulator